MSVIQSIVDQHAEEAAFCWWLRDAAATAPNYNLQELAELDERVEAHLDGLRLSGDAGWEACRQQLEYEEPGEVFVAAILAFPQNHPERWESVMETALAEPENARGLISALGWLSYEQAASHIERLLQSKDPERMRMGLAGALAHRQNPGSILTAALSHEHPGLRARALRGVGQLGAAGLWNHAAGCLSDQDPKCRFAAAWSGTLLGQGAALAVLTEIAQDHDHPQGEEAAILVGRALPLDQGAKLVHELAGNPALRRRALMMAGTVGDPSLLFFIMGQMANPEHARRAGEAFSFITGMDLEEEHLEAEPPPDFQVGPTEDPEDENTEIDPDEDLPWPDENLVRQWFEDSHEHYPEGDKMLAGVPMRLKDMPMDILQSDKQHFRMAAALERKLAGDQPLFETRAPAKRQLQLLQALS